MKRIVNKKLHYLDSDQLLSKFQCGGRGHKSTIDHSILLRLESVIVRSEHVVAVGFDMKKNLRHEEEVRYPARHTELRYQGENG